MIPPASISSPCRTLASSDPAAEAAGFSLDPTQEQSFGGLLDQQELDQSDPPPGDDSGLRSGLNFGPDPARQAALPEWSWPVVRCVLSPPDTAPPAPELAEGEEDPLPPPWPLEILPGTEISGAVGSFLPRQTELQTSRVPASFPAPAFLPTSAGGLPGTVPAEPKGPHLSRWAAAIEIPLRPAMSQGEPPAPAEQAAPPASRVPAALPPLPPTADVSDMAASRESTLADPEAPPASQFPKNEREPGTAPNVTNLTPGRIGILPLSEKKTWQQDAASPTGPQLAPSGMSHQAGNPGAATQGGKGPPPATGVFEPGDAKRPSPSRPDGPAAMLPVAPKSDEPARHVFTSLPKNGLQEVQVAGSAPGHSPDRISEQAPASGETSQPSPPLPRGAESPSPLAVPPAAAAFAAPAVRSPESVALHRSDLASLVEKVWEAADSLASAHRGRMDLDIPLRDNETVRIRVELRSGEIHATIQTDSPELREALEKSWPDFAVKTGERGFKLADANFSALRQDAGGGANGQGRHPHPEQNSWQHRHGGQLSPGGGQAQPRTAEAASAKAPAPAGPVTLWA